MSEKGLWANVATISKAKTNKGGLVVRAAAGLPFLLEEGMEVVFVPPVLRAPRSARVVEVDEMGPDRFLVSFDAVTDRNAAEALEGHGCLVRKVDLPEGYDRAQTLDIVGFTLVDAASGVVGVVSALEPNPGNPLLAVTRPEGEEVLVPLVEELLECIDEEAREISMRLPDGLLDL